MLKKLIAVLFIVTMSFTFLAAQEEGDEAAVNDQGTCVSGNCLDGTGKMTYPDGGSYTGQWKGGLFEGKGTFIWENGTKYTGQWADDEYSGQGTMTYPDGKVEDGIWQNGVLVED